MSPQSFAQGASQASGKVHPVNHRDYNQQVIHNAVISGFANKAAEFPQVQLAAQIEQAGFAGTGTAKCAKSRSGSEKIPI